MVMLVFTAFQENQNSLELNVSNDASMFRKTDMIQDPTSC